MTEDLKATISTLESRLQEAERRAETRQPSSPHSKVIVQVSESAHTALAQEAAANDRTIRDQARYFVLKGLGLLPNSADWQDAERRAEAATEERDDFRRMHESAERQLSELRAERDEYKRQARAALDDANRSAAEAVGYDRPPSSQDRRGTTPAPQSGGPAMPERETDGELIEKLQRCEPGLCVLPRAYPVGQTVALRYALGGLVVLDGVPPAVARLRAEYYRRLAAEMERAAAHVEKVVANGCEGTA